MEASVHEIVFYCVPKQLYDWVRVHGDVARTARVGDMDAAEALFVALFPDVPKSKYALDYYPGIDAYTCGETNGTSRSVSVQPFIRHTTDEDGRPVPLGLRILRVRIADQGEGIGASSIAMLQKQGLLGGDMLIAGQLRALQNAHHERERARQASDRRWIRTIVALTIAILVVAIMFIG